MAKLYGDISQAINNVKFNVRIPDSYTPVVPGYYMKYPDRTPAFEDNQPFSFSKLTCADIIDLCNLGVQFIISDRADVEVITGMITRYADHLRQYAIGMDETSKPVIDLGKCDITLNILRDHKDRATRDRTRNEESDGGVTLQSILSIMRNM